MGKQHSPGFLALVNEAKSRVPELTAADVLAMMSGEDSFTLIDVREESEWAAGRIKGAVHLSKGTIERDVEQCFPDKDGILILYCGGGYRSALAADALQQMGYRSVVSMDGGWRGWQAAQGPTEAGSG